MWVSPWPTVDQCRSRVTTTKGESNNVNLMFMAFLYLLKRMFDMEKDNTFSITFSITALSVYAISCVFFIFLVASLYIVGLTPMRNCFRWGFRCACLLLIVKHQDWSITFAIYVCNFENFLKQCILYDFLLQWSIPFPIYV